MGEWRRRKLNLGEVEKDAFCYEGPKGFAAVYRLSRTRWAVCHGPTGARILVTETECEARRLTELMFDDMIGINWSESRADDAYSGLAVLIRQMRDEFYDIKGWGPDGVSRAARGAQGETLRSVLAAQPSLF